MLENASAEVTIRPLIERFIAPEPRYIPMNTFTAACQVGFRPSDGVPQPGVNTPRDDDGDSVYKGPCQHRRGFWSLLRSWLQPHREFHKKTATSTWSCFRFVRNVGSGVKAPNPFCNGGGVTIELSNPY